jgi:hypothetical protein
MQEQFWWLQLLELQPRHSWNIFLQTDTARNLDDGYPWRLHMYTPVRHAFCLNAALVMPPSDPSTCICHLHVFALCSAPGWAFDLAVFLFCPTAIPDLVSFIGAQSLARRRIRPVAV